MINGPAVVDLVNVSPDRLSRVRRASRPARVRGVVRKDAMRVIDRQARLQFFL